MKWSPSTLIALIHIGLVFATDDASVDPSQPVNIADHDGFHFFLEQMKMLSKPKTSKSIAYKIDERVSLNIRPALKKLSQSLLSPNQIFDIRSSDVFPLIPDILKELARMPRESMALKIILNSKNMFTMIQDDLIFSDMMLSSYLRWRNPLLNPRTSPSIQNLEKPFLFCSFE
jgi:hypothetical protein